MKRSNKNILLYATILGLCLSVLFTSCYRKNRNYDEGYQPPLNREKMTEVLVDVQIVEGAIQRLGDYTDSLNLEGNYYAQVFEAHNITREQFIESFNYYRLDPGQFEIIYNKVIELLMQREMEEFQDSEKKKAKRDSSLTNRKKVFLDTSKMTKTTGKHIEQVKQTSSDQY